MSKCKNKLYNTILLVLTVSLLFVCLASVSSASAVPTWENNTADKFKDGPKDDLQKDDLTTDPSDNSLPDPYNPRTHKSYTTIQAAIDDPLTLPGDLIIIYQGTYHENVLLSKQLELIGQGSVTLIPSIPETGDTVGITILESAAGSRIYGITIQGPNINHLPGSSWIGYGILNYADDCVIHYNTILDCWIGIGLKGNNTEVTHNTINNSITSAIQCFGDNNFISHNTITNLESEGIVVDGNSNDVVDNTITAGSSFHIIGNGITCFDTNSVLDHNIITGFSKTEVDAGIVVINSNPDNSPNVQVINNIINDCYNGIIFTGVSNSNIVNNQIKNTTFGIQINPYYASTPEGPDYDQIFCPASYNQIIQNTISEAGMFAINLIDSPDNNTIIQNIITNCYQAGIGISGDQSTYNTLSQNTITSCHHGIQLTEVANTLITKNKISNSFNSGIRLYGCGDTTIQNNNIYGNTVGIWLTPYSSLQSGEVEGPHETSPETHINFNRIVNDLGLVNECHYVVDATNNWWGSNSNPSSQISGHYLPDTLEYNVIYNPWLVLSLSAQSKNVHRGGNTIITATLNKNNQGNSVTTDLDGISVTFHTDVGTIRPLIGLGRGNLPLIVRTNNGSARAKLTLPPRTLERFVTVTATIDQQSVELVLPIIKFGIH